MNSTPYPSAHFLLSSPEPPSPTPREQHSRCPQPCCLEPPRGPSVITSSHATLRATLETVQGGPRRGWVAWLVGPPGSPNQTRWKARTYRKPGCGNYPTASSQGRGRGHRGPQTFIHESRLVKQEMNLLTMFVPLCCPRCGGRSCRWGSWAKGAGGPVGPVGRPTLQASGEATTGTCGCWVSPALLRVSALLHLTPATSGAHFTPPPHHKPARKCIHSGPPVAGGPPPRGRHGKWAQSESRSADRGEQGGQAGRGPGTLTSGRGPSTRRWCPAPQAVRPARKRTGALCPLGAGHGRAGLPGCPGSCGCYLLKSSPVRNNAPSPGPPSPS